MVMNRALSMYEYGSHPDECMIRPLIVGIENYLAAVDRTARALRAMQRSNLRSNQPAIADLKSLLQIGLQRLEMLFRDQLSGDARPVEPLHFITKSLSIL